MERKEKEERRKVEYVGMDRTSMEVGLTSRRLVDRLIEGHACMLSHESNY